MNAVPLPNLPKPGEIVASGRIGHSDREFSFRPVRAKPSCETFAGFPGSVAGEWTSIGLTLCWRRVGSGHWTSAKGPVHASMKEALQTLGEDLRFPDHLLIHPLAIWIRNGVREEMGRAAREAEEVRDASNAEPGGSPHAEGEAS